MKPILKRLLIHNATYRRVSGKNAWGEETITEHALTRVRFEPMRVLAQTKENQELRLVSVLFYDNQNSNGLPSGMEFRENDNIVFDGKNYVIVAIDRLYDSRGFHHYELGLV